MPTLLVLGQDGVRRSLPLVKRVTSVGRHPDNDVRLEDPAVPEHAFTVLREGDSWRAGAVQAPFRVDGKRRDACVLTDGLTLSVGGTELTFQEERDAPRPVLPADAPAVLRRLIRFSATLLTSRDADALLEILLDEAVALTGADRGLVLAQKEGELSVRAARNVSGQTLADARHRLSDTVLDKVLRTGEPLLVQNALADPEFSSSASVVDLQLSSILCVPLGDTKPPAGL
ncbi:MAG: GAF domain-containing protein, partial [Myxococcaceae bacterium]